VNIYFLTAANYLSNGRDLSIWRFPWLNGSRQIITSRDHQIIKSRLSGKKTTTHHDTSGLPQKLFRGVQFILI